MRNIPASGRLTRDFRHRHIPTPAESLASIIDAPSSAASEQHNQQTHVWVSGGPLSLRFDLLVEAVLTGSNNEVDFNNLGFTGSLSEPAPNPQNPASAPSTLLLALGAAVWLLRQRVFQRD